MQDLRVQKTLEIIKSTFEEMILEMDYNQITVKELCSRGKINRKTFYRYYETLENLLGELQMEVSKDFIEKVRDFEIPKEQDKIIREFLIFHANSSKIVEKITCSGSYQYISNSMINDVMKETWETASQIQKIEQYRRNILTVYTTSSTMEIYKQWVADGKKIPIEELIEISCKLICKGINGFYA